MATRRPHPKDEEDWCKAILNQGKTLIQDDCRKDEAQAKIIPGEGITLRDKEGVRPLTAHGYVHFA